MIVDVSWADFKANVTSRAMAPQWYLSKDTYVAVGFDDKLTFRCELDNIAPIGADTQDFIDNYKDDWNSQLDKRDPDTGAVATTNRFSPDGFYQRLHEVEFTTATMGGALHDKDISNTDTGWSSCKFFKDVSGTETEWTPTDQADLDANCIRTDYLFMPNVDYMVKSGVITHQSLWDVSTQGEIYMWGKMLDVDPALNAFGIFPVTVLDGGMAMSFVNPRDPVGLKGVNGTLLYYGGVMGPGGFVPTGDGLGTNRITFIMRHNAGMKQRFQAIFEIFKA